MQMYARMAGGTREGRALYEGASQRTSASPETQWGAGDLQVQAGGLLLPSMSHRLESPLHGWDSHSEVGDPMLRAQDRATSSWIPPGHSMLRGALPGLQPHARAYAAL